MSVLVNTQNEKEEKVLLAFLDSLRYDYKSNIENDEDVAEAFLVQYNKEIEEAEADIDAGNFATQDEVEELFANRRKATSGN